MDNQKLRILMHGEDYVRREDSFKSAMDAIEKENSDWLKENINIISAGSGDKLHNHYTIYNDGIV